MRKIVIIGASSGLGMRIASDFARMGWRVGIAARRKDRLDEIKAQFPEQIEAMALDVTAPDAAERFYELIELIDGMDILLYASGTGWLNPNLDPARDAETVGVNVKGFTVIVGAAYRYFKATANVSQGRIAAITSIAGVKGIGISAAYSASKRYQWNYLQALDQLAHIQHVNVGITDIRPGFIDTALLAADPAKDSIPMLMSVNYAAPLIEKAILKGRRRVTVDSRWAVVAALWKLMPDCLWRHVEVEI